MHEESRAHLTQAIMTCLGELQTRVGQFTRQCSVLKKDGARRWTEMVLKKIGVSSVLALSGRPAWPAHVWPGRCIPLLPLSRSQLTSLRESKMAKSISNHCAKLAGLLLRSINSSISIHSGAGMASASVGHLKDTASPILRMPPMA